MLSPRRLPLTWRPFSSPLRSATFAAAPIPCLKVWSILFTPDLNRCLFSRSQSFRFVFQTFCFFPSLFFDAVALALEARSPFPRQGVKPRQSFFPLLVVDFPFDWYLLPVPPPPPWRFAASSTCLLNARLLRVFLFSIVFFGGNIELFRWFDSPWGTLCLFIWLWSLSLGWWIHPLIVPTDRGSREAVLFYFSSWFAPRGGAPFFGVGSAFAYPVKNHP